MTQLTFTDDERRQIEKNGQSIPKIATEIETFRKGCRRVSLARPCTVGDGVRVIAATEFDALTSLHGRAAAAGRILKFVPASGAASRMFKDLHALCLGTDASMPPAQAELCRRLDRELPAFAFYDSLAATMRGNGYDIEALRQAGDRKTIVDFLLSERGLNYGNLPKGLIEFHRYADRSRTAFEEHLVEAAAYALDGKRVARVHFTVAAEHREAIAVHLQNARKRFEPANGAFEIGLSLQNISTNTIAVDHDNCPFRDSRGRLIFRPGGHGALIETLQELQGDIVYIKNIDNVSPDRLKAETIRHKILLGGLLVTIQNQVFALLERIESDHISGAEIDEILAYVQAELSITPPPSVTAGDRQGRMRYLTTVLRRPIRVCGMVKNEGEPGGGPFWVRNMDGGESLQIVESSQVDITVPEQRQTWSSSTHFNPVDLVCGVRDRTGKPYRLTDYVDGDLGFITTKSHEGRELKALELPGLWNGAMAHWTTIFVEVLKITFNPVKTVFDLLRPEHRG